MSLISGSLGAVESAGAQEDATNQNAQNIQNTNAANLLQFQLARGSQGSSILPIYASSAEQQEYQDTLGAYDATGALIPSSAQLSAIANNAAPGAQLATNAATNVFNGVTTNQELNQQQPVSAATVALAQTQKQGSLEALQQTLNNIKSIQAGKGYSGDSYQNTLLGFQARQQANTAGAQAIAGANLTNAKSVQGIQENSINRELANLNAPTATAQNQQTLAGSAANALEAATVNRQNLFSNFRIGAGAPFQYQNVPLVQPNSVGAGLAAAAGAGNAQIGNVLANTIGNNSSSYLGASNPLTSSDMTPTTYGGGAASDSVASSIPAGEDLAAADSAL